jgi:hypothetical protein
MDSIKIIDENSFSNERPYYHNLQKIKNPKDIFEDPYKRNTEKKNHIDKFSELFANLYPENSNRLPQRSAGIIKKFANKSDNFPLDDEKFKNFFNKKKKK